MSRPVGEYRAPTFEVREGKRSGRYIEEDNVIEDVSFTKYEYKEVDDLFVGYYDYGCEGGGHYLGTTLPPGKYKIIRVNDE